MWGRFWVRVVGEGGFRRGGKGCCRGEGWKEWYFAIRGGERGRVVWRGGSGGLGGGAIGENRVFGGYRAVWTFNGENAFSLSTILSWRGRAGRLRGPPAPLKGTQVARSGQWRN